MPFLDFIYSDVVFGVVLAFLIAGGSLLPTEEFEKFKAAKVCWWLLAVYLCGRVLMWSAFTPDKIHIRLAVVFVAFGLIGVICSEMVRLVDAREIRVTNKEQQQGEAKKPEVHQTAQGPNSQNISFPNNQGTVVINPSGQKPPKDAPTASGQIVRAKPVPTPITTPTAPEVKTEDSKPESKEVTPTRPVTGSPVVYNAAGGKFESVCSTFITGGRTAIENHGEVKSDRDSFDAPSSCSPSQIKAAVLDSFISQSKDPSLKDTVMERRWAQMCAQILKDEFDEQAAKSFIEQPDLESRVKFLEKLKASIKP